MKEPISHPKLQYDIDFWQVHMLHHALSEYLSKSHNFKNLFFCDVITLVLYVHSLWRPENSENIWKLLWLSRRLIISTDAFTRSLLILLIFYLNDV